jgi:hypothetical protein
MKTLIILSAILLALSSCTKDMPVPDPGPDPVYIPSDPIVDPDPAPDPGDDDPGDDDPGYDDPGCGDHIHPGKIIVRMPATSFRPAS